MIVLYRVFVNIAGIVIFLYLADTQHNLQRDRRTFLKFISIASLGIYLLLQHGKYLEVGYRLALAALFLIIISYLILKLSIFQSVASVVTNGIALAAGDIFAVFVMVKAYGYSIREIKSDMLLLFVSDLIIYGTVIIIIMLIKLNRQSREITDKYKHGIRTVTWLYMIATFIIVGINYFLYARFISRTEHVSILAYTAIMWLYLILSLYIVFSNGILALKEQQYDQQQHYIDTMNSLINDFRRLKHSYANIIYSLYGYIRENDLTGLKAYYSEIIDSAKKMDSNLLLILQRIKVYAIFGLLWNKIDEAMGKGIEVGLTVINEVHEAGIKLSDLCEVLGNYLDNAIDAAAGAMVKKINISLADDGGYLTICIENTYEEDIDIREVQKKGHSTKGSGRGFGLEITNQILSRYANVLHNTLAEEGVFRQEIIIKKSLDKTY